MNIQLHNQSPIQSQSQTPVQTPVQTLKSVNRVGRFLSDFLAWHWVPAIVHWLVMSAGEVADGVFLIGTLWLCINASVHPLIVMMISDQTAKTITYFIVAAYVGLPEFLVGLAIVRVFHMFQQYWYNKDNSSLFWCIVFTPPTFVFFGITLYTISCSVASIGYNFELPSWMVVLRGDAGFLYALSSMVYDRIAKPYYLNQLKQKDELLSQTSAENESHIQRIVADHTAIVDELNTKLTTNTDTIDGLKRQLDASNKQHTDLLNTVEKYDEQALQAYSQDCRDWLKTAKTTNATTISQYTGIPKRKIERAIQTGAIELDHRNKDLVRVNSLIEWLKVSNQTIPSTPKTDNISSFKLVNAD